MDKQGYLDRLREALAGLPEEERAERLSFYSEMIDDLMEEGLTEEEACLRIGPAEEVAAQILAEAPAAKPTPEAAPARRRLQPWEIVLLILGFPVWLPLLAAAFAVVLALVIVLWALVLCLWAVELALAASAVSGVIGAVLALLWGEPMQSVLLLSAGLVLAGLSIFLFFGCRGASRGAWKLTKQIVRGVKRLFRGKETTV